MFLFQRNGQTTSDRTQNFQQLRQTIVCLCILSDPQEQVHNLLLNISSQPQKLAINPMQDRLEVVTLSWILRVKKFQVILHKWFV